MNQPCVSSSLVATDQILVVCGYIIGRVHIYFLSFNTAQCHVQCVDNRLRNLFLYPKNVIEVPRIGFGPKM